jgi:hypothetical protein
MLFTMTMYVMSTMWTMNLVNYEFMWTVHSVLSPETDVSIVTVEATSNSPYPCSSHADGLCH